MTHLTIEHREIIEDALKEKMNFTEISDMLGYHRTSISAEIKNRRVLVQQNLYGTTFVNCEYEHQCDKFQGIGCKRKCNNFKPKQCPSLNKPPYVCNGCSKKHRCRMQKYFYRAKEAQKDYDELLKESREGIRLTQKEINTINTAIVPLIKEQGQSINQVYINHPDILYFSKTEFYRLISLGYFDLKNIDLRRKVKYKSRNTESPRRTREEAKVRVNRTYKDFEKFVELHKEIDIIEMDTVEGLKGGKVMLTLLFVTYNFMLIFLLESQTKEEVIKKFKFLKQTLTENRFKEIIKVLLTDNGKEFYGADEIEQNLDKTEKITNLFYCDPMESNQKPHIEKNHEYIRYILPKGTSFDNLTQEDCNIIMSHINSVPRESLKNKTPYQAILNILTREELLKLGVIEIEPDKVNLTKKIIDSK
ncbi:MAG: IS30 family transposase [Erysipelotrichaceae bacterium]|nr:IS30 family transposase [Erysipelotrichaceae bacterium]